MISPWLKSSVQGVTPVAKVTLSPPRNGAAKLLAPVAGVHSPSRLPARKARKERSLCLYFYAKRRVRKEGHNRRRVVVVSALAPFLALLWLVTALLIHIEISN